MAKEEIYLQKGKKALLIAPYYDRVTTVSSTAERALIGYLKDEGMKVSVLEGENAIYGELEKELKKREPRLVAYFGHSTAEIWYGQQPSKDVLMDVDRAGLLTDSVVISMSCNSLRTLGGRAVTKKADGYLGFVDVVHVPVTQRFERNFRADFIRTLMHPVVALVRGYDLANIMLSYRDLCNYYADMYEKKRYEFWNYYWYCMKLNGSAFSYAGAPKVKL